MPLFELSRNEISKGICNYQDHIDQDKNQDLKYKVPSYTVPQVSVVWAYPIQLLLYGTLRKVWPRSPCPKPKAATTPAQVQKNAIVIMIHKQGKHLSKTTDRSVYLKRIRKIAFSQDSEGVRERSYYSRRIIWVQGLALHLTGVKAFRDSNYYTTSTKFVQHPIFRRKGFDKVWHEEHLQDSQSAINPTICRFCFLVQVLRDQ